MKSWLALLRPGDWLVLAGATVLCGALYPLLWRGGIAEKAVVRAAGKVVAELDLSRDRLLEVKGPLGKTTIAVEKRRVRVQSDPGPRQYCVKQGWLVRPGEIAICAPNEVSVQIEGRDRRYDSLGY